MVWTEFKVLQSWNRTELSCFWFLIGIFSDGSSVLLSKAPMYIVEMSKAEVSGQSYKQLTLVIYESRVVIWGIFKSGTTLEL